VALAAFCYLGLLLYHTNQVIITVIAFNLIGEAIRDSFDVRLRGGRLAQSPRRGSPGLPVGVDGEQL
jgi:hypothetical protein